MKRDPDVILSILQQIVESDFTHIEAKLALAKGPLMNGIETERGRSNQIRAEHVRWMLDDGLLTHLGGHYVRISAAGCEFYENAKAAGVWQRAKNAAAEQGGTIAFELFRDLVNGLARKQLKKYTDLDL